MNILLHILFPFNFHSSGYSSNSKQNLFSSFQIEAFLHVQIDQISLYLVVSAAYWCSAFWSVNNIDWDGFRDGEVENGIKEN